MSYINAPRILIRHDDSPALDAFGRARVSEVTTQIDLKQLTDRLPLFIDTELIGTGTATHDATDASTTMATSATNDAVIAQTYQRFNYQTGKSQQIFMTFAGFHPQANAIKRIGYFSSSTVSPFTGDLDGLFLESSNGVVTVNIYKSGTLVESIPQLEWNVDKLNGEGISAITVDWSKSQILLVDFEWLGAGRVRWSLVTGGQIIPFHNSMHANLIEGVYMTSPNQPLRWELRQTGAGSASFKYICATVGSEGGLNELGKILSVNDDNVPLVASSTASKYTAIALRLKTAGTGSFIDIVNVALYVTGANTPIAYEVLLNPTIAGVVSYTPITNSALEVFLGATANTVTGGTLLDTGYVEARTSERVETKNAIRIGSTIDGVRDTVVLVVRPLAASSTVHRSITWREQI
jgi:hypothetical protein